MSPIHPLPTSDGHEPRRVTDGLDRVMKRLGAPGSGTMTTLYTTWPDLVGEQIASHTRPVSLTGGVLVVTVDDGAWASQLRWLEARLIERLTDSLGVAVDRLEVRVRPA